MKLKEIVGKISDEKICLIRVGAFFCCIGKDSYTLEKALGLKRTCFGHDTCKVGIPVVTIKKYIEKIEEVKLNFVVYDYCDIKDESCEHVLNQKGYKKIHEFLNGRYESVTYVSCCDCLNSKISNDKKDDMVKKLENKDSEFEELLYKKIYHIAEIVVLEKLKERDELNGDKKLAVNT